MARFFKILSLTAIILLTACDEGRDAGDLHGQWRMSGSDTKFIGFSGSVTMFRSLTEGEVFGNFQHVGDSLFIQCYSIKELQTDTTIVEESYGFRPFNNIRLKIESIDDDNLLISKGDRKWSFYKY
jgi:hypothetical protein